MPENLITHEAEFVLRRTQDAVPTAALFLPVAFAFLVLLLIALFRHEGHWSRLLWSGLFVAGGSALYLLLAFLFKDLFTWYVVLVPVLAIGLAYVGFMYRLDAQTVHPLWAAFLGLLRCGVYAILACVFLLPGCQNYTTSETHSKVLFLLDVSDSMGQVDEFPRPGEDPARMASRQDKVIRFLTDTGPGKQPLAFLERVLEKAPVTAYRFGAVADDLNIQTFPAGGKGPELADLTSWLKPDKDKIDIPARLSVNLSDQDRKNLRSRIGDLIEDLKHGTNVGGSALQVARLEAGSLVQAIVIVSDGQSNQGTDAAVKELLDRVNNPKRPTQIFTVGVGKYRQPVSIRVESLQAPSQARPDDKFPIRVPVFGTGLQDEDFTVTLEARRVEDGDGQAVNGGKTFTMVGKGKFKGGGENPNDEVEFEVDMQQQTGIKADADDKGELEGTWEFVAKVPRNPREVFKQEWHVSDPPTRVAVRKRKLRVLLFAGGPSRKYQFVRTLFYRESLEKRMDLAIYLQTGREEHVDQDVESEWLLSHFPDKLGADDPKDKHSSLNEYDVILAFDPDWEALDPAQLRMLKEWVGTHAGGLVFIAGPVHSYSLARGMNADLTPLITLVPVVLKDSRLVGLNIGHDPSRPYALHFAKNAAVYDFIKLEEDAPEPLAAWDQFFWDGNPPEEGKDVRPVRGFYNYYPVEKIKPASSVLATFAGPTASMLPDGTEQPFLVSMAYGNGKTFYIGSGEMWRLRQFKESYYERFWIKLARFVASGSLSKLSKYGHLLVARQATTGAVPVEVQILGEDMKPLPRDARPVVNVKRPTDFNEKLDQETPKQFPLRPKNTQGEWNGWFTGVFHVRTPGIYELSVPIPGTSHTLTANPLDVRKPDLERDNTRPNFGALYQLASSADKVLERLNSQPAIRSRVLSALQPPSGAELSEGSKDSRSGARLFFPLESADLIPECLVKVPPSKESVKGQFRDLWDEGVDSHETMRADYLIMLGALAFGVIACGVLAIIRRWTATIAVGAAALAVIAGVFLATLALDIDWVELPLRMSYVLGAVVTLLGIEWMTRKLLKLA